MTDSTAATADNVTYEQSGSVAIISIDDGKANALGHPTLAGIAAALDRAEADAVTALVIAGREGRFSAGFDLSVMTAGPNEARELVMHGAQIGIRLAEFKAPVVLAVTGHALAMGAVLLCCADVRVGCEGQFKIGLNEVRIGMPVPAFVVELCRDRLSPRHFTRAVQLGHVHTPSEAVEAGFLDELVDPDAVVGRAVAIAEELGTAVHPTAFKITRSTVRDELIGELRQGLEEDLESFSVEQG